MKTHGIECVRFQIRANRYFRTRRSAKDYAAQLHPAFTRGDFCYHMGINRKVLNWMRADAEAGGMVKRIEKRLRNRWLHECEKLYRNRHELKHATA